MLGNRIFLVVEGLCDERQTNLDDWLMENGEIGAKVTRSNGDTTIELKGYATGLLNNKSGLGTFVVEEGGPQRDELKFIEEHADLNLVLIILPSQITANHVACEIVNATANVGALWLPAPPMKEPAWALSSY